MTVLTSDLTFQLNDTGVLLNSDSLGTPFVDILDVSGLDSAPFRETQRDHEGVDGGFMDAEFETGRDIILQGTVYATDTTLEPYLDSLRLNYQPSRTLIPFYVKAPGVSERVLFVKPRGVRYNWDSNRRLGICDIQFLMFAEDPRIYSSTLQTVSIPLGSVVTTGRGYNKSYNYGYGTIILIPDGATVTNNGNREAPAIITISGPVDTPRIVSDTAGKTLQFNIVLGVSDTLTIDLLNHTVFLNGTVNRRTVLNSPDWFLIQPGANILRYRAASSPPGTASVAFRDTYR